MAVDLSDLIDPLRREVSLPDDDLYDLDEEYLLGQLQDAFWECRLDGMLEGFEEDGDGSVTPTSGSADLTRDLQQLVVLYAGYRIVRNYLRSLDTKFRAVAGPVEYETARSAQLLVELLKELKEKRAIVLKRLSDLGAVNDYYIDAIISRDESIINRYTYYYR